MSILVDSVRVESRTVGKASIRLEGTYALFEMEQAIRGLRLPLKQIEVNWTRARIDHSAFELERLANLLSALAPVSPRTCLPSHLSALAPVSPRTDADRAHGRRVAL